MGGPSFRNVFGWLAGVEIWYRSRALTGRLPDCDSGSGDARHWSAVSTEHYTVYRNDADLHVWHGFCHRFIRGGNCAAVSQFDRVRDRFCQRNGAGIWDCFTHQWPGQLPFLFNADNC